MARLLLAGLPPALKEFLEQRLDADEIAECRSIPEFEQLLSLKSWDVVVLDGQLIDATGMPQLLELAARASWPAHVMCSLDRGDLERWGKSAAQGLGVQQFLIEPLDREALIRHLALIPGVRRCELAPAGRDAILHTLWQEFHPVMQARIEVIERACEQLADAGLAAQPRRDAEREAHKLAGAVGTFGFLAGTDLAAEIERTLGGDQPLARQDAPRIRELVEALKRELTKAPGFATPLPRARTAPPRLLVLEDDGALARAWRAELADSGFEVRLASSVAAARTLLAHEPIEAVVMDLGLHEDTADSVALLGELRRREPAIPAVVVTGSADFNDRLEVARIGGAPFLQKPVEVSTLVAILHQLLGEQQRTPERVLAVDDDPAILATICQILTPLGLDVHTSDDPLHFWALLNEVQPDLLILDLDMPVVTGIDLCRALRADPEWFRIPVIFLSGLRDAGRLSDMFRYGADDYVAKPLDAEELGLRVRNRLERSRQLRDAAEMDPLTGLANRRRLDHMLRHYLKLAERTGQPVSVALLDLDHFKAINDRHGHPVGDRVLRQLAQSMIHEFRAEDVAGRWGGEEFLLVMYGSTKRAGARRLEQFLARFAAHDFLDAQNQAFQASFSAGIAEFPQDGADLATLARVADGALYHAKHEGRRRVRIAAPPREDPAPTGAPPR